MPLLNQALKLTQSFTDENKHFGHPFRANCMSVIAWCVGRISSCSNFTNASLLGVITKTFSKEVDSFSHVFLA